MSSSSSLTRSPKTTNYIAIYQHVCIKTDHWWFWLVCWFLGSCAQPFGLKSTFAYNSVNSTSTIYIYINIFIVCAATHMCRILRKRSLMSDTDNHKNIRIYIVHIHIPKWHHKYIYRMCGYLYMFAQKQHISGPLKGWRRKSGQIYAHLTSTTAV